MKDRMMTENDTNDIAFVSGKSNTDVALSAENNTDELMNDEWMLPSIAFLRHFHCYIESGLKVS